MLLTVFLIAFLIYTSILSAFYGSDKASVFFSSTGMSVFWVVLLAALSVSLFAFRNLHRRPGPLLTHLGCILILAGSMYAGKYAHHLRQRFMNDQRIYEGYLVINEGFHNSILVSEDRLTALGELPFNIALDRFRIDRYEGAHTADAMPRQFYSDVVFFSPEGTKLAAKTLSVNHPAHFAGYYFYQSSYGRDFHGPYSILHVTIDSGIPVVYAGYILLCAGVVWSLWAKVILPAIRRPKGQNAHAA